MKTNLKLATVACAAVVGLGVIGCGGGGTPTAAPTPTPVVGSTPDYAKKVAMDTDTAKKALFVVMGEELYAMGGMSASATDSKEKRGSGMSYLPYMLISFLQKFTHTYSDDWKYEKGTLSSDSDESNITLPCYVSGSYTVYQKWSENDTGEEDSWEYFKEYTFDNCVHNAPVSIEFDDTASDTYRFTYNGKISFQNNWVEADRIDTDMTKVEATNFHFTTTENTKKVQELTGNFSAAFSSYDSGSAGRMGIVMNGDIDAADFNATSGDKLSSFVAKTVAFDYKVEGENQDFKLNLDGYLFIAPDMNASHEASLYGEAFTVDYLNSNDDDDDTWTVDINGVIGTSCLGGTVAFDTVAIWDANNSMPDYNGDTHARWTTPFAGKTTIAGANDDKVVLEFGVTGADDAPAGRAYGTLVEEDVTPDVANRKALPDLIDGNCTIGIFGG